MTTDRKIFDYLPRRGIMAEIEYPGLAQLVARLLWEQDVGSSSLPSRTTAPEIEGFMFIGTQCDLWGRPDGTGYEKSKSREFPSTYFFFDPKFI